MPYADPHGEKAKARTLRRKLDGRANLAARKYAAKHPEKVKKAKDAWNRKQWQHIKDFIAEKKVSCRQCGYNKHPIALDFHHRNPSEKSFGIATFRFSRKTLEDVKKEIEKCDVLCANCHRLLEYGEG